VTRQSKGWTYNPSKRFPMSTPSRRRRSSLSTRRRRPRKPGPLKFTVSHVKPKGKMTRRRANRIGGAMGRSRYRGRRYKQTSHASGMATIRAIKKQRTSLYKRRLKGRKKR